MLFGKTITLNSKNVKCRMNKSSKSPLSQPQKNNMPHKWYGNELY